MPDTDPVADILRKSAPLSARASAWDAFEEAKNEDDLAERLKSIGMPREVKAQLWDMKRAQRPATASRVSLGGSEAKLTTGEPESAFTRAARAVKEAVIGDPERADAKAAGIYQQPTPFDLAKTAGAGGAAMLGGAMAGQVAAAPMAAARGLGLAALGSMAGKKIGGEIGGLGETLGLPKGTRHGLETAGAVIGGGAAPIVGPRVLGDLVRLAPHSRAAVAARYFMGSEPAAAATADPLIVAAQNLAKSKTFTNSADALAWLKSLRPEQQASVLRQLAPKTLKFPVNPQQATVAMRSRPVSGPVAQSPGAAPVAPVPATFPKNPAEAAAAMAARSAANPAVPAGEMARVWLQKYAAGSPEEKKRLVRGLAGKLNYEDMRRLAAYTDDLSAVQAKAPVIRTVVPFPKDPAEAAAAMRAPKAASTVAGTTKAAAANATGFDGWRKVIWDDVKSGRFHPEEVVPSARDIISGKVSPRRLFRAVSDAELRAAKSSGNFRPVRGDNDLYVTADPDRLAGGAYGAKAGGHIIEFDVVPVHKATGRLIDVDEIAATEIPTNKIRKIWTWDPKANDHLLTFQRAPKAAPVESSTLEQQLRESVKMSRGARKQLASAQDLEARIVEWNSRQGLSEAQIVAGLKQTFGIREPGAAKEMVDLVLRAHGLKK